MESWKDLCTIRTDRKSKFSNGGWAYDAYPELETLDAGSKMTVADLEGPGVITCIHTTQHIMYQNKVERRQTADEKSAEAARGVIIEIYFDGHPTPSVRCPLGDFFADGCSGRANNFGNMFIEKAPKAYNCFIPMPFKKSARVIFINETDKDYWNYSFVEYEQLPEWDDSLGYFHATWSRRAFQLDHTTDQELLQINGAGHLLGRSWSVSTDEPTFGDFTFVMEANNEFRIDGEAAPTLDYLGTEDSFAFSWGFSKEYNGPYAGMNYIKNDNVANLYLLSIYRFMRNNVIRFSKSLNLRLNWSKEEHFKKIPEFFEIMKKINEKHAWIDYAMTTYWYQSEVGFNHEEMQPLEERCKTLLRPNHQY